MYYYIWLFILKKTYFPSVTSGRPASLREWLEQHLLWAGQLLPSRHCPRTEALTVCNKCTLKLLICTMRNYTEKAYNIVCVRCQTAVSSKTCSQPASLLSQSTLPAWLNCFTAWYTVMLYGNTWLPISSSRWCLVTPCDIDTAAYTCNRTHTLCTWSM